MIVCSCARIRDREVRTAVRALAEAGKSVDFRAVYRQMQKRPRCGNCRPLIQSIIKSGVD